ncbi:cytochrome c biogenesis heme-transporting ATPase CcmA [Thalassotalea sp. LPB0316]|uniref:cytochrome c biogenesis heme-transporting ATPase CcmA n=1 Tax=Thalassotalea sp. LPB0316 TaxID=2769490 RepID=UPI0018678679|nr:cytochrome c biogenesis heme-transporting ATPase CcmA [Thalassotalea sp. LPB0316]QOL27195.1 cytochrome c biogenesis heme-transporting ATPase CcmA [Thalassotalea sp. LPB0316]
MTLSNSNALLKAENLTCIREDRILFEELSCQFKAGDIVQIAGPNGAGKTSLLRILAGLSQPYEGNVFYQNTALTSNIELYNQNLTYIGHLAGVKGEMTAQENLEFYLAMHGQHPSAAEQTLEHVNLLGFEDALASHLSAGQHRRIALARLWQCPKPIWILDEPFTAIDKQGVKNLENLFLEHADKGGCVILTTHQDLAIDPQRLKTIELSYQLV